MGCPSLICGREARDKRGKDFPSNLTQASFKCISDRGSLCGDLNENCLIDSEGMALLGSVKLLEELCH